MGFFTRPLQIPTARFPEIGTTVGGRVTSVELSPVPEFDDKGRVTGPKFDLKGTLVQQVDVTVADADGHESVIHTGGAIFEAIQEAIAKAGLGDLSVGDMLYVTYTGNGKPPVEDFNPPKLFAAEITAFEPAKA